MSEHFYNFSSGEALTNAKAVLKAKVGTPTACIFWCGLAVKKRCFSIYASNSEFKLRKPYTLSTLVEAIGYNQTTEERRLLDLMDTALRYVGSTESYENVEPMTWGSADEALKLTIKLFNEYPVWGA